MAMEFLHTMVRVRELDAAIRFFELLGLVEVRRKEVPAGRFTLVFMATARAGAASSSSVASTASTTAATGASSRA